MVTVKYGEPYRKSFGKTEEKFKAKTIEELVTKIEKKYKGKEYTDTIRPYSVMFYNDKFIPKKEKNGKYAYDSDIKLKKNDEIMFMMLVGGG